jgi:hypothetical protein
MWCDRPAIASPRCKKQKSSLYSSTGKILVLLQIPQGREQPKAIALSMRLLTANFFVSLAC